MKYFKLFLCTVLLFTLTSVSTLAKNEGLEGSKETSKKNKYIEQYYKEKAEKSKNKPKNKNDYVVDPETEEKIILDTLSYYYDEDLKVANILSGFYQESTLLEKTVSLIKEEKIDIMHKIQEIYYAVEDSNQQDILRGYLDRYAQSSGDNTSIEFLNEISVKSPVVDDSNTEGTFTIASTTYNAWAAGNWAYNNYNKYSTNYPAFTGGWGTDCTNFISQAMHVGGGKPMEGNWYIYKKNSTYLVPKSADQLNYSWTLSDPSPWISVVQFRNYWRPKSTVYAYSRTYYEQNHKTIYNSSIVKGDVVVLHKGTAGWITTPTHLMIISDYDTYNKDFRMAGHSNERQALPVLTALSSGPYDYVEFLKIP